ETEFIYDDQVAFAKAFRKCRTQSAAAHFLRHLVRPITRLRAVYVTAAFPQGRAKRSDACASRSLLLPKLAARTGNISACFRCRSSLASVRLIIDDRRVDQSFVQLGTEYGNRQR